ncbi:MAG: hypothetical protein R3D29_03550 [Nitratireductor sp.]
MPLRGEWLSLDLENEQSVKEATAAAGEADIVCVATGMLHEGDLIRPGAWNAIDPHAMAQLRSQCHWSGADHEHFLPVLSRQGRSVMALLSARVGSISITGLAGGIRIARRRRHLTS